MLLIKNWLWKSDFHTFWETFIHHEFTKWNNYISEILTFFAENLAKYDHRRNSMTVLTLISNIYMIIFLFSLFRLKSISFFTIINLSLFNKCTMIGIHITNVTPPYFWGHEFKNFVQCFILITLKWNFQGAYYLVICRFC